MKRKICLLLAAIMMFSTISVFAMDYAVPEDALEVTARFFLVEPDEADDEFVMVSEDGELVINITNDTLIYFEDYVPLSDECEELTKMVRDVLFGYTLAEVLDGRNMRVIYEDGEEIEPISIMVLFESFVTLPEDIDLELEFDELDPIVLNGEIVVNNEILEGAALPFVLEEKNGDFVMVPLRAIAEALDYEVGWNAELRSVQLGVAIHLWIGNTEVHLGRMAPIELSTAPIIVDDLTFVPIDFIRYVLGQTVYVFEGQVVIETYSDMM